MKRLSRRSVIYAVALLICWYLAFYTEWDDNALALVGLIVFLKLFYAVLWPERVTGQSGRQRGVKEIIPKGSLRWIPEAVIDQPVRKRIASQGGANTPAKSGAPGSAGSGQQGSL